MDNRFVSANGSAMGIRAQSGEVQVRAEADDGYDSVLAEFTPAQARELAAAILRAADEAEGEPSRLDIVREALRSYAVTPVGSIDYYEAAVTVADLVGMWFPKED